MEAADFKKALTEVLDSLEIKVDLTGTLSFNVKDTITPPIEPEPSTGPPIEPEPSTGPPTDPEVNSIFLQDFTEVPLDEAYTLTKAKRDFGDCKYSNGLGWQNLYNVKIVDDNDTRLMRVKTHKDHISPDYGFQFHKIMSEEETRDEIYFSYNVIFSPYFEPVKGGKLPGLWGGKQTQWGKDTGFTCRMMFKQECSLDFYVYWPDMDSQYGKHFGRFPDPETGEQFSFYHETEVWHNITQRLVLNTAVDKADGFIEAFIDGKLVKHVPDMRLRADMDVHIEEMAMTHFFGGNTQDWAPSKNQYIKLDDVTLFEIVETNGIPSPDGRDISFALPKWPKSVVLPEPEPSTGPPVTPPSEIEVIFEQDFTNSPEALAYKIDPDVKRDFGETKYSNGLGWQGHYNVLCEEENGNSRMRVKTRKNQIGPDYGFQFHKMIDNPPDELWFSYNIIFSPYFEPVLGGKLPGLAGGPYHSGGGAADGFLSRMMFKQNCSLDFYLYWPEMPGDYGSHFGRFPDPKDMSKDFSFYHETEVWHNITQRIKLNPKDSHSGFIEAFIDGICVKRVDNLLLRNETSIKIEEMAMTHFFGGGSMDWAPSKDQWIKIDDVLLFKSDDAGHPSEIGRDIANMLPNWPK